MFFFQRFSIVLPFYNFMSGSDSFYFFLKAWAARNLPQINRLLYI